MKLKQFVCKAASIAMCAMIIGTTVVSVNVKADTKATESTVALDTHDDDGVAGILEQDDFDTLEEYQKYLETHPKVQTRQSRVSANKNVKAAATLRYKIKGLTNTAAIQKTYIGSTYIYVIQRIGSDSRLSRCLINGSTSHMSYANKSGTSIGEVKRVDAALSSDRKKVFFWVMDNTGEIQYSFYNAEKLNAELDKKESEESKFVPCTSSAVKSACYGSFRQSGSNRVLPNDSCQGLEFSDGDSIYIIGGAAGQKPGIAKLTGSGSSYKYSCLVTATHNNFGGNAESEGIQLKGDYVYFGISDKQSSDKACIYSIPKSAF